MIGLEFICKLYNVQHKDLAEALGIKKQNINLWLRDNTRKIPKKYLPILSEYFNIPEQYFQKELTELDEYIIQNIKLSNTEIKHEYEDTITNEKGEHIKVTRTFNEGVDIDGLRLNDINMKKWYVKNDIDKAIEINMNKQSVYEFGDLISIGEYVIDLYKDFNELIINGDVRLDIIKDIINGMRDLKKDSNETEIKRSAYTKKITREVQREQQNREDKDRVLRQQEEDFNNEEIRRYQEEQQPISEAEKERRKIISELFK